MKRYRGTNLKELRVIKVVETVTAHGKGTEADPARYVEEYWSLNGERLAVCDSYLEDIEVHSQRDEYR